MDSGQHIKDEEFSAFLGPNDEDYIPVFREFEAGGDKFIRTWNWGALLGGPWWFLYRKMYKQAGIFMLIALPIIVYIPILALLVIGGFTASANYLYYKHAKGLILEQKMMHPYKNILPTLTELGGIHKWAVHVGIIGTLVTFWIIVTYSFVVATMPIFLKK